MAVSSFVVIGTSRGISLVFEPKDQILKLILGTKEHGDKHGAVTALGINCDCTRLLCGYARGHITMWDLGNGNCLRVITDAHPMGYAVLHIQFTDDPTVAMLNDSSGSVYTLSFKRRITRTCEASCFFSGSKGEVCAMSPLNVSPNLKKEQYSCNVSLLAMASLSKLIVVDMSDKPVAVFTQKMTGPMDCLPLLCWYFTLLERRDGTKEILPVLSFARNQTILLYRVEKIQEQCVFECYRTHVLDYTLIAMAWLNSQVMVTVDTFERIRTIDTNSGDVLECLELSKVQLVYSSSYFKSLSNGGNVSDALYAASDYACYQSVQFYNGQLFFLGTKTIHCLTLRSWKERLDFFVRRNEFVEALELAKSFYLEKGKAVIGLAGTKAVKKQLIGIEITNILLSYLDIALLVTCPKTNDEGLLVTFFRNLARTCIEYLILIHELDILFNDVYDRFSETGVGRQEFLLGLEYFILEDKLTYLSPVLMQDLVEFFEFSGRVRNLQSCIVHLNLTTINIDHMVKLCWEHELYDLFIYVYNKGLSDYITPLESLLSLLRGALDLKSEKLTDHFLELGQKILVYLSCCLAGHQYPLGKISSERVAKVKKSVFRFLFSKHKSHNPDKYANLKTLLLFDTRELLNVLSLAFEEKEFDAIHDETLQSKRQYVIDILIDVLLNSEDSSPTQIGCLFTFIARQKAKFDYSIQVNKTLFNELLEFLTNQDETNRHEERQQALLELHAAGALECFDEFKLLQLAESARFYLVCEIFYKKDKDYYKVFSCYWRDSSRSSQVYTYIDEIVNDEAFTELDKDQILEALLAGMDQLVEINSIKFARLILNHFPAAFNNVATKLQSKPEIQYTFFKGVFHRKGEGRVNLSNLDINPVLHERFIELMCTYEPECVCSYLESTDNYRVEEVLAIVQGKRLVQPSAYLFEKKGDIQSAFELLHQDLREKIVSVNQTFQALDIDNPEITEELKEFVRVCRKSLRTVMQLCQRNSAQLELQEREGLWFPLLDSVLKPQQNIKDKTCSHFVFFKELTKDLLMNMMELISLPTVLQRIMQDPAYSSGKFSDIKELIFGMVDTYNYELVLLETTQNLLGMDLLGKYNEEKKLLTRGFKPTSRRCLLCTQTFTADKLKDARELVLFRCGHVYHRSCLQTSVGFEEELLCLQCSKSSRIGLAKNARGNSFTKQRGKAVKRRGGKVSESSEHHLSQLSEEQEASLEKLWNLENPTEQQEYLFKERKRGFFTKT